jgi:hypothetical protein
MNKKQLIEWLQNDTTIEDDQELYNQDFEIFNPEVDFN